MSGEGLESMRRASWGKETRSHLGLPSQGWNDLQEMGLYLLNCLLRGPGGWASLRVSICLC